MGKTNFFLAAGLLVGAVIASFLFARTITKEAHAEIKQAPKFEIVGYTGRSFTYDGVTMVEVRVKNPDGTYSVMFCPCIQGSACWPKCAREISDSK